MFGVFNLQFMSPMNYDSYMAGFLQCTPIKIQRSYHQLLRKLSLWLLMLCINLCNHG